MAERRSADELRAVPDPAWPLVEALIDRSPLSIDVLSAGEGRRDEALEALQITSRSVLGALVGECGALMVDNGWLRILGAGADDLPGVHEVNGSSKGPPPLLDVAWDVLGGRFALNGGDLDAPPGEVCYWGPDTLDWSPLGRGHADFVAWALSDSLADFYATMRWPGWESEVAHVPAGHGIALMPPPFTVEGRDLARVARAPVPLAELHGYYDDMAHQLDRLPDGATFELKVTE